MRKRVLIPAGLVIVFFTLAISASLMDRNSQRRHHPMSGLPGVRLQILVKGFDNAEQYSYLTEQAVKAQVELMLRQHRIRIISDGEIELVPGQPALYVNLRGAVDPKLKMAAVNVALRLVEDISLSRNHQIELRAETWSKTSTILANFDELEVIPQIIDKQTLHFCELYAAYNPSAKQYEEDHRKESNNVPEQSPEENQEPAKDNQDDDKKDPDKQQP